MSISEILVPLVETEPLATRRRAKNPFDVKYRYGISEARSRSASWHELNEEEYSYYRSSFNVDGSSTYCPPQESPSECSYYSDITSPRCQSCRQWKNTQRSLPAHIPRDLSKLQDTRLKALPPIRIAVTSDLKSKSVSPPHKQGTRPPFLLVLNDLSNAPRKTAARITHTRKELKHHDSEISASCNNILPPVQLAARDNRRANRLPVSVGGLNRNLKRKMVFRLHEEVKLSPPIITILEEISDMSKITEMCMNTLKSMMSSRRYRKFLYHVNNNALTWEDVFPFPGVLKLLNLSNNSEVTKKKQFVEKVIGKTLSMHKQTDELMEKQRKELNMKSREVAAKQSQTKHKIEGLADSKKYDKFDAEAERSGYDVKTGERWVKDKGESSKAAANRYVRRDSMRPSDARLPSSIRFSNAKDAPLSNFSFIETVEPQDSDTDLAVIANVHLTQREKALKLLAEIQMKIDRRQREEDEGATTSKSRHSITPEEALHCAWLRLSKAQIATLEELIRQQGKEPGIHAHSDVSNYDVFAEVREIRKRERSLREEDEFRQQARFN